MDLHNLLMTKKLFGGSGGSDTPSGNLNKKFMTIVRQKRGGGYSYDFVTLFAASSTAQGAGVMCDEGVLPTKTLEGIKVSTGGNFYFYFIEDENDICAYGDAFGSETYEWTSLSNLSGVEFGGVITDLNQTLTVGAVYAFIYYAEAEGE